MNSAENTIVPEDTVPPVVICFRHCESMLVEKPATFEEWRAKAEALWALIDDIDTAGDMFKPEMGAYFRYVNLKVSERFQHMKSDGYRIINT